MKILRSFSLSTLSLFVAGAWIMDRPSGWYPAIQTDVSSVALSVSPEKRVPEMAYVQGAVSSAQVDKHSVLNTHKMWASTSTVYKGETLQLQFATPNAPYLGLIDPRGHFFYLVFPAETAVGALTPLVESKRFVALQSLAINTGSLEADPYTYGVYANQPVFTQSGTYTFILGENLHVDDSALLDKVAVRYIHGPRPARASSNTAMN